MRSITLNVDGLPDDLHEKDLENLSNFLRSMVRTMTLTDQRHQIIKEYFMVWSEKYFDITINKVIPDEWKVELLEMNVVINWGVKQ